MNSLGGYGAFVDYAPTPAGVEGQVILRMDAPPVVLARTSRGDR
jgi:hypothetical protein